MTELLLPDGPTHGPFGLLDHGDGRVVLVTEEELVGLDLTAGRVTWRRPREVGEALVAPVAAGDRLVELEASRELAVLDAVTGRELGRLAPLEGLAIDCSCGVQAGLALIPFDAGRVVLATEGVESYGVFCDLEARTTTSHRLAPWLPRTRPLACAGALVVETEEGLTALEPEGTRRWWRIDGVAARAVSGSHLVLRHVEEGTHLLVEATDGRTLGVFERDWLAVAPTGKLVVGATLEGAELRIEGWRATGPLGWTTELGAPAGTHAVELHVDARRVVAVATNGDDVHPRAFAAWSLDLASGEVQGSRPAPDPERLVRPIGGGLFALGPTSSWPERRASLRWS